MSLRGSLDAVRRPEYTGENRCLPCTLVNSAVVLVGSLVLTLVSGPLGLLALVVGAALIYLRGYVVPYTPEFAPRLVEPLPVNFHANATTDGGRPAGESDDLGDDVDGEQLMTALFEAGVLVETEQGGIDVAPDVLEDWEQEMAGLREREDGAVAAVVADAAPFDAEGRVEYGGVTVEGEGQQVWLAKPLAIADASAVRALAMHGVDPETGAAAATPMRMFLRECPECGGDVAETTYRNCCGGTMGVYDNPETPVLACEECDAIVFEFDDEGDEAAA